MLDEFHTAAVTRVNRRALFDREGEVEGVFAQWVCPWRAFVAHNITCFFKLIFHISFWIASGNVDDLGFVVSALNRATEHQHNCDGAPWHHHLQYPWGPHTAGPWRFLLTFSLSLSLRTGGTDEHNGQAEGYVSRDCCGWDFVNHPSLTTPKAQYYPLLWGTCSAFLRH